jgi:hypothetical protein
MIILKKETQLAATQPFCNLHETYVLIMLIKKVLYQFEAFVIFFNPCKIRKLLIVFASDTSQKIKVMERIE